MNSNMRSQESPPVLPTYAEAMRTQPHVHHETMNEYGATSPPYNPPYPPPMAPYPTPTVPNYSQSVPISEYPPYQSYEQHQSHHYNHHQQQQQYRPPVNIPHAPTIHVIRNGSALHNRKHNNLPKIIFGFIFTLIMIAVILRVTIRHR